jgi:hypothetical protein
VEVDPEILAGPPLGRRPELWQALVEHARPSVRLTDAGPTDPAAPGSRLGGVPLAGADFTWPRTGDDRPLSLLAQLDSDEINAALDRPVLPPATLLAFFYDADGLGGSGLDPADAQYWRVLLAPAATATPAPPPDRAGTFPARAVTPTRVLTVPERWEAPIEPHSRAARHDAGAVYRHLQRRDDAPLHRAFGWPDPIQGPMAPECEAMTSTPASDWRLLLQLDTDDAPGWMWGDAGTLYYWVRHQDLTAADFSRVWAIGQSH